MHGVYSDLQIDTDFITQILLGALNLQGRKMSDKSAGLETAGLEIDGQKCSRKKCGTRSAGEHRSSPILKSPPTK